jgi:hypothetical protein
MGDVGSTTPAATGAAASSLMVQKVAVVTGALVYTLSLLSFVVIFAGNKLCSLGKRGDMQPLIKIAHVLWWTLVVSLGMTLIITVLSGLLFKLIIYCIPHDAEAATVTFNMVVKQSWAGIGGMLLLSSVLTSVLTVILATPGLASPYQAIDITFIVAAVQLVALLTWTVGMV